MSGTFDDFVPQSRETLRAQLEALNSGSDPAGIVPLPPGLIGQKLATAIRAKYPPIPESEREDIRAIMPNLITLGVKLSASEDLVTHWHGYGLLMLCAGMAVGMRRVPHNIFSKIESENETVAERQLTARIVASFLCDVYPPVSDEEFNLLEPQMVRLTNQGEIQTRTRDYRICVQGIAMLTLALGFGIGRGRIPLSIGKEFGLIYLPA